MFDKTEYQRQYIKQYRKTEKGKLVHQKTNKKYRENHKEKVHQCQRKYRQTEKGKLMKQKTDKKHRQTEKYKVAHRKAIRKSSAKRKRNLGWIKLFENPFDELEKVEWHHINNTFVVAIPKDLHRLYYGKNHKENEMRIIEQIYGGIKNDIR